MMGISQRLRMSTALGASPHGPLMLEAADAIDNLNAINAELLEALKDALLVMTSQKVTIEEQADAITNARAAIAKAGGES